MAHKVEITSKMGRTHITIDGIEIQASSLRFEHASPNEVPELVLHIPALDVSLDTDFLPTMPEPWRTFWDYGGQTDSGNSEEKLQE